jgi:hypothetical protein
MELVTVENLSKHFMVVIIIHTKLEAEDGHTKEYIKTNS